jgi:predicted dehydrogenase
MWVSDFQPEALPEVYPDYRAMLEAGNVDAVLLLTAVDTHHTITVDCLEAGKHVMVEKPLAITVRAGQRMVQAARERDLVLATAECQRFLPEVRAARWAAESGKIGKLQAVLSGGMGAGKWSPDGVVWNTPWRHQKLRAGGGATIDSGVHMFDILRYVGGEITEVSGIAEIIEPIRVVRDDNGVTVEEVRNEVDDLFWATCRFANGAVGQVNYSFCGHGEQLKLPNIYYGDRGSLYGNRLTVDGQEPVDVLRAFREGCSPEVQSRLFPLGLQDDFALELYDWIQAIQQGREAEVTGSGGLRDLAVSYAVIESSVAQRWVSVEEVETGALDSYQKEIDEHFGLR